MSELIDRERFSADMRDFQNRVGIWRDEAEDTETRTRADAALATIIETKLILDKQPTIPAPRWRRVEEPPKDGQECIVAYSGPTDWIYEHATYHSDLNKALEEDIFIEGTDGFIVDGDVGYARHDVFKYWMPIEPPKEDA